MTSLFVHGWLNRFDVSLEGTWSVISWAHMSLNSVYISFTSVLMECLLVKSSKNSNMDCFYTGMSALDQSQIFLCTRRWYLALTSESTYTISWSLIPGSGYHSCISNGLLVRNTIRTLMSLVGKSTTYSRPHLSAAWGTTTLISRL